jgi:Mg/Co/Ni transporter MgtE
LATEPDKLRRLDSVALADLVARLPTTPAVDVLRAVGTSRSIDALDRSHDVHRRRILRAMSTDDANRVVEDAPADLARSLATLREGRGTSGRRLLRTAGWRLHRPEPR